MMSRLLWKRDDVIYRMTIRLINRPYRVKICIRDLPEPRSHTTILPDWRMTAIFLGSHSCPSSSPDRSIKRASFIVLIHTYWCQLSTKIKLTRRAKMILKVSVFIENLTRQHDEFISETRETFPFWNFSIVYLDTVVVRIGNAHILVDAEAESVRRIELTGRDTLLTESHPGLHRQVLGRRRGDRRSCRERIDDRHCRRTAHLLAIIQVNETDHLTALTASSHCWTSATSSLRCIYGLICASANGFPKLIKTKFDSLTTISLSRLHECTHEPVTDDQSVRQERRERHFKQRG